MEIKRRGRGTPEARTRQMALSTFSFPAHPGPIQGAQEALGDIVLKAVGDGILGGATAEE